MDATWHSMRIASVVNAVLVPTGLAETRQAIVIKASRTTIALECEPAHRRDRSRVDPNRLRAEASGRCVGVHAPAQPQPRGGVTAGLPEPGAMENGRAYIAQVAECCRDV